MPSSVRPKGAGGGNRAPPVTPMSERQQMALLMQMTSGNDTTGSRSPSSSTSRSRERNERGETPLHLAAIKGDVEQVCRLLAQRADPNVADFAGWTPLHEACNHGWYEVAFRLIQSGANVNAKGLDNDTPLHDAVINGHIKLIKLLVERGADIHAKNAKGKSPLDLAPPTVQPYLLNPSLSCPDSTSSTRVQSGRSSRDDKKSSSISDAKQKSSGIGGSASSSTSSSSSGNASTSQTNQEELPSEQKQQATPTAADDVYEFKSNKDSESSPEKSGGEGAEAETEAADPLSLGGAEESSKRPFTEVDPLEDSGNDEENKRKKRKDDNPKEGNKGSQRNAGQGKGQGGKQTGGNQSKSGASSGSKGAGGDKKSPCSSPKPSTTPSDPEGSEEGKTDLKVPPLKIVIPQSTSNEQETGTSRNGKSSSQRSHQALPYVVSSNSNDSTDKDLAATTGSPESAGSSKESEKKESGSGQSEEQTTQPAEAEPPTASSAPSTTGPSPAAAPPPPAPAPTVELHPRKRKMKQSGRQQEASTAQQGGSASGSGTSADAADASSSEREVHPHDQPITNCYKLFLSIRKQIEKRRKGLFPVQPKPPQGFKDYLMNRCTYVLSGTAPTTPNITYPVNLPPQLKDLFAEQEKERYRLRMQHVIEKEKLVLSVEQEILRVHGRAARALANQALPFSVCTILRDEEVYNLITPEQEEKDRNARSRYNGRLFLSWLQDVDDKWEKIKEHMLLRHHNEAESLHAVQKMNWEWKMKEHSLCDRKSTPKIDEVHVPMVHVSDDFDLLPA